MRDRGPQTGSVPIWHRRMLARPALFRALLFTASVALLLSACAAPEPPAPGPTSVSPAAVAIATMPPPAPTTTPTARPTEPPAPPTVIATTAAMTVPTESPVPPTAAATAAPTVTAVPPTATAAPSATPTPTRQATPSATPSPVPQPSATRPPAAAGQAAQAQPAANTALWRGQGMALAEGTLEGVVLAGDELRLAPQGAGFAKSGTVLSPEYEARLPFDNAVLSWNARAPAGTSLRFALRARVGGMWTSWYTMGIWDAAGGASERGQADTWGEVDVDTLDLRQPAQAWQYRVTLTSQDGAATPALRQLALAYADLRRPLAGPRPQPGAGWARDLAVPAYSQLEEDPAIARTICSPTSLAMILNYYGKNKTVAEVARGVRDRAGGIFGNWPLNTAYAATLGMEGYVDRFFSMEQLQEEIAQGRPVAISIRFQAGELSASPIPSTTGHLIVVRGFTPQGNVIVNDPIAPSAATVRRVYDRRELESVWLRSGGVAYLIRER